MDQTTIAEHGGAIAFLQAPLPAASAWALGTPLACSRCDAATYQAAYTRGDSGGKVKYRTMISIDEGTTFTQRTTEQLIGVSPPAVATHQDILDEREFASLATGEQTFEVPIRDIRATHIRLDAAESGVVGTPGIFAANVRFFRGIS